MTVRSPVLMLLLLAIIIGKCMEWYWWTIIVFLIVAILIKVSAFRVLGEILSAILEGID